MPNLNTLRRPQTELPADVATVTGYKWDDTLGWVLATQGEVNYARMMGVHYNGPQIVAAMQIVDEN